MRPFLLFAVSAFFALPLSIFADDGAEEHHAGGAHAFHPNHFAVFAGGTTMKQGRESDFTLGVDYVRRLAPSGKWGIGGAMESIFGEHKEWLFLVLGYHYFTDNFMMRAGPGIEFLKEAGKSGGGGDHEKSPADEGEELKDTVEPVIRLGLVYIFRFGSWSISPSFDSDFVRDETSWVWGLNFGYGW